MSTKKANQDFHDQIDQKVQQYLEVSGNCAQTSFISLQEVFDLEDGGITKALTPFPGIALRGETCGAVVGSLMALGLVYGRDKDQLGDYRKYLGSLPSARRFCRAFEKEFGSTMCADIVEKQFGKPYDLADQAQALEWANQGAVEKCGQVIRSAVHIAVGLIAKKVDPTG